MARSERIIFTAGLGVDEIISEFMEAEKFSSRSQAINRIIINFGKIYQAQKQGKEVAR